MNKWLYSSILFFALALKIFPSCAQVISPEQFLGYPLGTKYTPHWKVIEYFKKVALASPATVKLEDYGLTNEGRELMVAFISSQANISNLENIRLNNLALARMTNNKNSFVKNSPVIVWLSYNVHGNEASSTEASMLTLYSLADPANQQSRQWLVNTVIIIDPCLNPDGRERYINWFTSISGKHFNPSLNARELHEPWPGGRTNHYNFDLNRDWAWQTQTESVQRMVLYENWLPQIHVDYHEQGFNAPYYFAPAAQPYHEVITKWQRDFQEIIGRNHARYFDKKGWLYFTKEEFDLLYPSYGDTYPVYNGAIGMTYEQAGLGGGLGLLTGIGDTLTLSDRLQHHYTTSLSTIEVASLHAEKLVSEFQKFFNEAVTTGTGNYRSYVLKYRNEDAPKINALVELLQKNKIKFGTAKGGNFRGFNYDNGKLENVSLSPSDIIIPSIQPKSALVKVLFEPDARLADSVTYDITAWSLPYVYGLTCYATTQRIDVSEPMPEIPFKLNMEEDTYGYVIQWNGMPSVRILSSLLQKGIKPRFSIEPFELNGQSFNRGSLIILKTSNQGFPELWSTVRVLANENKVPLTSVHSGFVDKGYDFGSTRIHPIKPQRIAVLTGDGVNPNAAGEVWFYFDQIINYPVTLVNANDFSRTGWKDYDVLIMPDGYYKFLNDKSSADELKNWVNEGGKLIALEGSLVQLAKMDWGLKLKKADEAEQKDTYEPLRKYESRDRDQIPNTIPGSIFRVELDNTHPLAFGYPSFYYTLKQDSNIYEFIKDGGWNVGVLKKDKQVSGFVGSKLRNRLQDGLLFGVQEMGRGKLVYLADDILFRSFWENGKMMFANAVFLVGQ